ncbi:MAG: glycosyltransferase [Chitinophagaceae bacterium]
MATAVIDMEVTNLSDCIRGLNKYDKALILLRCKGRPIGKITVPVCNGKIIVAEIHQHILNASATVLSKRLVLDYLKLDERKNSGVNRYSATIAICTRDRTDDLRNCLNAILKLPDDGQEILVIDNCPKTSDTRLLVESYGCVRYVCEERPGLNIARNRALSESKRDIVAFLDDDVVPDSGWLRALVSNFEDELIVCVTGLTMPLELETEGQELFEYYNSFGKGFERIRHSIGSRNPLASGQVGAGANMAFRKTIGEDIGLFDEALDAGTPTQSGGDHEFFLRILIAGYHIIYDPAALNWHRHRRTRMEAKNVIRGYGIGVYAFWTRTLLVERELEILKFPLYWFIHYQLRNLAKSILKRKGSQPLDFVVAELCGCLRGPFTYLKSRKKQNVLNAR